jgi:heme exporter protein A
VTPPDFDSIELQDVTRRYGRRRALSRVTLTCRAGEIVGLFGPNGAGKSTLLAICSTLLRPTSGRIHYGGKSPDDLGDGLRSSIGLLGHDLFLYSDMTARENLEFFGHLYGLSGVPDVAGDALRRAGLEDRAGDRVGGFSRGLRQRLAFERAVLHTPRVVLLDEPFTGLDDEATSRLCARLDDLRRRGAIVLMATHDFDTADGPVDRAMCLAAGRMHEIQSGAGSLRDRYRRTLRELRA